jgi:rhodanese-related sulfurtransferase
MQTISIRDYQSNWGNLIDVEDSTTFKLKHLKGAINIPYETILYNKDKLLDKNKTYYIYCQGGRKSRQVVSVLEAYGYKVVRVLI